MRTAAAVVFAMQTAACLYPQDVSLVVPELGTAGSVAFATRDGNSTTLETFNIGEGESIVRARGIAEGESFEVAALLYSGSLAQQRIPAGELEVPSTPSTEGRDFPFERGFSIIAGKDEDWTPLEALPDWLQSVRLPGDTCTPITSTVTPFGLFSERVVASASNGSEVIFGLVGMGTPPRYFVATSTSLDVLDARIPQQLHPRVARARIDGDFVIAGNVPRTDVVELWRGRKGAYTKLVTLDRNWNDFDLELGHDDADRDYIYLIDELGEVVMFDGADWSVLRPPQLTVKEDDDRFGIAWIAPRSVLTFGPYSDANGRERFLSRLGPGTDEMHDLGESNVASALEYIPSLGTLAGTTWGDVFRLSGDGGFENLTPAEIYRRSVVAMVMFRGELATGGTHGAFAYMRAGAMPCLSNAGGMSLTSLFALDDGQLVSANRSLNADPVLVRIR